MTRKMQWSEHTYYKFCSCCFSLSGALRYVEVRWGDWWSMVIGINFAQRASQCCRMSYVDPCACISFVVALARCCDCLSGDRSRRRTPYRLARFERWKESWQKLSESEQDKNGLKIDLKGMWKSMNKMRLELLPRCLHIRLLQSYNSRCHT